MFENEQYKITTDDYNYVIEIKVLVKGKVKGQVDKLITDLLYLPLQKGLPQAKDLAETFIERYSKPI